MTNRNELERFVAAYNDYCAGEFGNDAITVEEALRENALGVLYTTAEEDADMGINSDTIEFQISYILNELALEYYIDGKVVKRIRFENLEDMIDDLENFDFEINYSEIDSILYELLENGDARIEDNEFTFVEIDREYVCNGRQGYEEIFHEVAQEFIGKYDEGELTDGQSASDLLDSFLKVRATRSEAIAIFRKYFRETIEALDYSEEEARKYNLQKKRMTCRTFEVAENCINELLEILHRNDCTLSGSDYEKMQSDIYKLKNFVDLSRIVNNPDE